MHILQYFRHTHQYYCTLTNIPAHHQYSCTPTNIPAHPPIFLHPSNIPAHPPIFLHILQYSCTPTNIPAHPLIFLHTHQYWHPSPPMHPPFTFYNDDVIIIKLFKCLCQRPLVMTRYLQVALLTLSVFHFPLASWNSGITQIRMLQFTHTHTHRN